MLRSYLPSLLGRDDDPFGSLFRRSKKRSMTSHAGLRSQGLGPT